MKFFKNPFRKKFKEYKFREPKYKPVHLVVDDALIMTNDPQLVIDPLWWSVDTDGGEEKYEKALSAFTKPQQYIFAI